MSWSEQASVLATSWANNEDLKCLGAKHSLCVIEGKKITRSPLKAWVFCAKVLCSKMLLSTAEAMSEPTMS